MNDMDTKQSIACKSAKRHWSQALFFALAFLVFSVDAPESSADELKIGWAQANLSPDRPVAMRFKKLSEGVMDPIFATVLALENGTSSNREQIVLVSCDLLWIPDGNRYEVNLRDRVRNRVGKLLRGFPTENIVLSATHTHVAPSLHHADEEYVEFIVNQISNGIAQAWQSRKPGGVGYGLGHAALSHNRIVTHRDGSSRMVGSLQKGTTANQDFSHIEGFEDHAVQLLFTVNEAGELTGILINTACPAQVQRGDFVSADFWHEARAELRNRLGDDLFILPQVSAAGDLATTVMVEKDGEKRMQQLRFPDVTDSRMLRRKQIATRIADSVTDILSVVREHVDFSPTLARSQRVLTLPLGFPEPDPRAGTYPIELNAVRIGDVGMVTNPFELYCDYGVRIKGRSPAVQTFVVELAGSGSYVPTERAVSGGGYGAIPKSCIFGPAAGDAIVANSLAMLNDLWIASDQ